MSTFSGSVLSKKKQELQELSNALDISEGGTRDELQQRLKQYLALHESTLADNPRFSGLYGRSRKKSAQPQLAGVKEDAASISSDDREERTQAPARKVSRQVARSRAVPQNDSLTRVAAELDPATLPPLPPSPIPSAVRQAASAIGRDANAFVQRVKQQERSIALEGRKLLGNTQTFLSDANNIYTLTLLTELALVLKVVFPMSYLQIPLSAKADSSILNPSALVLSLPYPTPASFFSLAPWVVVTCWVVPTLVLPMLCGALVSFNTPPREVDPLTVGIIRVACSVAGRWGVEEDILPSKWRVLSAAVGAAFAFAEAVGERKRVRR